nr:immunoglobulin heavy chain junction region [Mus musculus]
LCARWILYGDF